MALIIVLAELTCQRALLCSKEYAGLEWPSYVYFTLDNGLAPPVCSSDQYLKVESLNLLCSISGSYGVHLNICFLILYNYDPVVFSGEWFNSYHSMLDVQIAYGSMMVRC